jgi:hypothetical protein
MRAGRAAPSSETLDLSLLAAIVAVFALTGWRPSAMWVVFGGGLTLLTLADVMFLTVPTTATLDTGLRPLYTLSMLVLGFAAWQRTRHVVEVDMRSVRVLILPSVFALVAAGVLAYGAVRHVPAFAVGLAVAALAGVVCRTWITVREIRRSRTRMRLRSATSSPAWATAGRCTKRSSGRSQTAATQNHPSRCSCSIWTRSRI